MQKYLTNYLRKAIILLINKKSIKLLTQVCKVYNNLQLRGEMFMIIKQISIFVENKMGRLSAVTKILKDNNIDIRALSIADTKDFGILRIIVNNPDKACQALKSADCTVTLTEVIAIGIKDEPGGLAEATDVLQLNSISIEYMYAFISKTDNMAYVILRVNDNEKAIEILSKNNIKLLTSDEIYNM